MSVTRETCFYVPGSTTIVDVVIDGKTAIYKEDLSQVRSLYPEAVEMDLNEAFDQIEKAQALAYITEPIEITEDRYIEMLEVLPPMKWEQDTFMLCEFTAGCYTSIFCKIGGRFFEFTDSAFLKPNQIIEKVLNSKAFQADKGSTVMSDTIKNQLDDELHYAASGTFSANYLILTREYSLKTFFRDKPDLEADHNNRLLELAENYDRLH